MICLFGGFVFKNITIVFVIIEIKHGEKIITNKGMLIQKFIQNVFNNRSLNFLLRDSLMKL